MFEDFIIVNYQVRGFEKYIRTIEAATVAHKKLAEAQKLHDSVPKGFISPALVASQAALEQAKAQAVLEETLALSLRTASAYVAASAAITFGTFKATQSVVSLGIEVANLRDLMGSSSQEAYRFGAIFRAMGINDSSAIRTVLHLDRAMFSRQGQSALARLGVPADPNVTGTALFSQIQNSLSAMPSGFRKTKIIQDLIGNTGGGGGSASIRALLPLLRLTKEETSSLNALGDAYDKSLIQKSQDFQVNLASLGGLLKSNLIQPIVSNLLPVWNLMLNIVGNVLDVFGKLDRFFGGIPTWILTIGLLSIQFALWAKSIILVNEALKILRMTEIAETVVAAIRAGIASPWALVGATAILGVGAGLYAYNSRDEKDDSTDQFGNHVDRFGSWVNRMEDSFGSARGQGIPGRLQEADISALSGRIGLGGVG